MALSRALTLNPSTSCSQAVLPRRQSLRRGLRIHPTRLALHSSCHNFSQLFGSPRTAWRRNFLLSVCGRVSSYSAEPMNFTMESTTQNSSPPPPVVPNGTSTQVTAILNPLKAPRTPLHTQLSTLRVTLYHSHPTRRLDHAYTLRTRIHTHNISPSSVHTPLVIYPYVHSRFPHKSVHASNHTNTFV